jgi:ABC-2 type transport system ATP-binding protein
MTMLHLEGVRVTLRPHFWSRPRCILRDVSINVGAGEIYGFLGANGAGKTTTIKTILGLTRAAGHIEVLGSTPTSVATRARVGYMPEGPYFPEQLSARELIIFHGTLAGLPRARAASRAPEILAQVGLQQAADHRLRTFSKGMLQRVGLAQALIHDPELIILDEPMSGLDPLGRRDVREIMVSLRAQGKTVFFSTHILPDVELICDRVGIIASGRTRQEGRLTELIGDRVERVEVVAAGSPDDAAASLATRTRARGELTVLDTPDLETANRLIDRVRANGGRVSSVQVIRPTLEDLVVREAAAAREEA